MASCTTQQVATPTANSVPKPPIDTSKLGKNVIVIYDDRVEPSTITINVGEFVTWVNAGTNVHNMRSGRGVERFQTGVLDNGGIIKNLFSEVGETEFADTQNPDKIKGRIVVRP